MMATELMPPDSVFIILGDFNHINVKKVLPRYKQHVDCATCTNILDHCYTAFNNSFYPQRMRHLNH